MPKLKCTPCMSQSLKEAVLKFSDDPKVLLQLKEIETCPAGEILQLCVGKVKRKRSAYQEFVSKCLKEKHIKGFGNAAPALTECAGEWRERSK